MHSTLVVAREQRERNFFVGMAVLIAVTIAVGFGSFALRGLVVRPIPLLVHLHGFLFVCWVALFVAQTLLIQRNDKRMHRRVGWLAVIVALAIIVVGPLTTVESVTLRRVPEAFIPNIFLAVGFLDIFFFASLVVAAIALRKRTDWHRRLMLGAMIAILGPAWGRILPLPLMGPFGGLALMGAKALYTAIGMGFDLRVRGKIHPAYYWVLAAVVLDALATPLVGMSPPLVALAKMLAPH